MIILFGLPKSFFAANCKLAISSIYIKNKWGDICAKYKDGSKARIHPKAEKVRLGIFQVFKQIVAIMTIAHVS